MQRKLKFDTISIHGGYEIDKTTNSVTPPIYMTNAYRFNDTEHAEKLFSLEESGNIYTRIMNPTCDVLEKRTAMLDGGIGALAFTSGHSAMFTAFTNLAGAGDEIVSSSQIYGGAINMMGITLKRLGINIKFVDPDDLEAWENAVTDKTKAFFFEVLGNPNANVCDIENICKIAHKHNIPVIADSTFTTPYLCRPIEYGADFTVHSATKFLGGHSNAMAGIIVDSGNFNFKDNPRFPLYNEPDVSYHGVIFADMKEAFIARLRTLGLRDIGGCLSPFNAFIILQGIETLPLRMKKHCENAQQVAEFLDEHPFVSNVNYPGLTNNKYHELALKYMPLGSGSVLTFELKNGKEAGIRFINNLKLICHCANLGDIRTLVTHPASTTHSQLNKEQLEKSGISEGLIRLSIGIEDCSDIIDDLSRAIC